MQCFYILLVNHKKLFTLTRDAKQILISPLNHDLRSVVTQEWYEGDMRIWFASRVIIDHLFWLSFRKDFPIPQLYIDRIRSFLLTQGPIHEIFEKKNIENWGSFFESASLEFFCLIPMKISNKLVSSKFLAMRNITLYSVFTKEFF